MTEGQWWVVVIGTLVAMAAISAGQVWLQIRLLRHDLLRLRAQLRLDRIRAELQAERHHANP